MPAKEALKLHRGFSVKGGDGFSLSISSLNTVPRIRIEGAKQSQTCTPCTPETIRCSSKCTKPCGSVRNCVHPK